MNENFKQALEGIVHLGRIMCDLAHDELPKNAVVSASDFSTFSDEMIRARLMNAWFQEESTKSQLIALGSKMNEKELLDWLSRYEMKFSENKSVAIIMAGNIPLVGFHDLLCALLCGYRVKVKLSSDDSILLPALIKVWSQTHPQMASKIEFVERKVEGFDAVIATGSNNSARYFQQYFGAYPHLIRKNRTSVAVLTGEESEEDLNNLGKDVFKYFGLGCRNVTKVFVPEDYNLDLLFKAFFSFKAIVDHNKYANNYDYHKALWLMNQDELLDNGFLLVKEEEEQLVSPVGSLFVQRYKELSEVEQILKTRSEEIQCVVGTSYVPFGKAQKPELDDYADGIDTIQFLLSV